MNVTRVTVIKLVPHKISVNSSEIRDFAEISYTEYNRSHNGFITCVEKTGVRHAFRGFPHNSREIIYSFRQ